MARRQKVDYGFDKKTIEELKKANKRMMESYMEIKRKLEKKEEDEHVGASLFVGLVLGAAYGLVAFLNIMPQFEIIILGMIGMGFVGTFCTLYALIKNKLKKKPMWDG